jgi:crotonobetainyl-CoA:carnitine CoA-transferase CaiB-like acyl-CoA transferase
MPQILDGVRVLDFGRYIAGPYCACLLADLGADVIRVDRVEGSEDRWVSPVGPDGTGSLYLQVNRNKRGITLNPSSPAGREVVARLVATADVIVANLPEATLASMGLDEASVRAIKPDVVLTTATAFGRGGPYSERVGFDGVGQSMSGAAFLSGDADRPTKSYVPWVDYMTATLAAFGTVSALWWRDRTGEGQRVEGALLRTAMTVAGSPIIEQALIAPNRVGTGNRSQTSGPSDIFATRDGWIIVQVVGRPLFERWAKLMGDDEGVDWLSDPRFADDASRGNHGEVLSARTGRWCAERTTLDALAALEAARIPAGPVYSPQQTLDDPHVAAAGLLEALDYPGLTGPVPMSATAVTLSATPGTVRFRPPTLGEHTDEVLASLGYDAAAIADLRASRTI